MESRRRRENSEYGIRKWVTSDGNAIIYNRGSCLNGKKTRGGSGASQPKSSRYGAWSARKSESLEGRQIQSIIRLRLGFGRGHVINN